MGIETDKAVVDFEMQDEGYVAKIMYPDGTKDVELGKAVAILVEDPEDIAAFADWQEGGAQQAAPAQEAPQAQSA